MTNRLTGTWGSIRDAVSLDDWMGMVHVTASSLGSPSTSRQWSTGQTFRAGAAHRSLNCEQ